MRRIVDSGDLECVPVNEVILHASNGVTYAVNGSARGEGRWADLEEIWRIDPATGMDVSTLIQRGLALCP